MESPGVVETQTLSAAGGLVWRTPQDAQLVQLGAASVVACAAIAIGFASGGFTLAVFLAWRKVVGVPDGRGDVTGLVVATVAGAFGLAIVGAWVQDPQRRR